ncbi:MAG: DUF91 domain-containing protein [Candidatus Bathyarchaeota archaeon]|nr:MAG: DUF91 domain-containing protein [Candidatus Bathyarchaeota archaeon]
MYKLFLYYDENAAYADKIPALVHLLENIRTKWQVDCHATKSQTLSSSQVEQLREDIRNTIPQLRGKIVSSRSKVLPLSKNKNPNLTNTPVLLLLHNEKPINVFPHLLGTTYSDIEPALQSIAEDGPKAHLAARGLLENPIQKILADDPATIESEMRFVGADVKVDSGVIDILLQDARNKFTVVEIETRAREIAVAQVCRLAASFASFRRLSADDVRKAIVCQQYDENVVESCKGANVELYAIGLARVA